MSTTETPRWTIDAFAGYWDDPVGNLALVPAIIHPDVVGHWAGVEEPVRGRDAYVQCIADLVTALPDLRLDVAEHATSGNDTFVRWIMHATGAHGPFEMAGIDRVRVDDDGLVIENHVVTDPAVFERRAGIALPWR